MRKTWLIFKHEFANVLGRKGFIIMTLIVPILALLVIGVIHLMSGTPQSPDLNINTIGYVDEAGGFEQFGRLGNINFIRYNQTDDATDALIKGNIKEYFVIPQDYISTGIVNLFATTPADISSTIGNFLLSNLLNDKIPPDTIERVKDPVNLVTTTLTKNGTVAPGQDGSGNTIITLVFSLLFAMSMVFSSTYMIQGLGEEKENRIMEVLLSSVSPRQLLTGKILGLSAAGLMQVVVWVASLPFLLRLAFSSISGFAGTIQLPAGFLILGIVFFILGYLLFTVLAAGVGAVSSTTQEGQQLSGIYAMFAVVPVWCTALIIMFPNSPVWTILTIFPLTAPVMVMVRLGLSNISTWEIAVSISVLVLSVIGGLFFAAKVFKDYLLSYGKRSKLKEIMRRLK